MVHFLGLKPGQGVPGACTVSYTQSDTKVCQARPGSDSIPQSGTPCLMGGNHQLVPAGGPSQVVWPEGNPFC